MKYNAPVLHSQTSQQITSFVDTPSHAILLIGPNGSGKTFIAKYLASLLLEIDFKDIEKFAQLILISPEKNNISIDQIRDLQKFLQLKTAGEKNIRRIVIVEQSQYLNREAQNAFLKMLEEPPSDTVIILTCDNTSSLLPTIISRVQSISIYRPSKKDILNEFKSNDFNESDISKNYYLSSGLPGLLNALLEENNDHPLVNGVIAAKEMLSASANGRLIIMDKYSKKKNEATYLIEALVRISETGIVQASVNNDQKKLLQWHKINKASYSAETALSMNANLKLVLTNLALQL